jgi:hypothetical protein
MCVWCTGAPSKEQVFEFSTQFASPECILTDIECIDGDLGHGYTSHPIDQAHVEVSQSACANL